MEKQQGNGLIYGLNDKPPFKEAFFAALQHLLAIFVAIITPPLIIAGALKLDAETTGYLVSMALFASGISTFIQCRRFGGLGTGLLCIQGTSFSFIGPIISAGMLGGLPLIFGSCMAASSVEMLISRVLKYTKKIITPLISGIVVTLIGMSLIKVGITACGGGATAQADGSFGHDAAGPATMTTADIAAQADAAAGQTTEKEAQPAAAAPQEPAKRQRLSGEELDALRQEALHAYEAKGYDLKKAEWDAGRALSFWTMTDCKRLIREAAKLQPKAASEAQGAAAQEQPEAPQPKESPAPDSTQAGSANTAPEPEQVQGFVPPYQTFACPHNGAQITEDDCYDCKHRTGCPHWEAAPAADA